MKQQPDYVLPASESLRPIPAQTAEALGLEHYRYPSTDGRNTCVYTVLSDVWIRQELGAWQAMLRIVPSKNGNPIVAEVRLFPHEPDPDRRAAEIPLGEWAGCYLGARAVVPEAGVTARLLKTVKIGEAVREAQGIMRQKFAAQPTGGPLEGFWPSRPATRVKRGGRKQIPIERLVSVAATYAAASRKGALNPVQVTAKRHRLGTKAANWIRLARVRLVLERTDSTRPGGELTAWGRKLWEEIQSRRANGERV